METSGFFTSKIVNGKYDRSYTAEQFAQYFSTFIGNGIFAGSNALAVSTASDGMKVNVVAGKAWINGYWYENNGTAQVELNLADGTQSRIDAIVLRWSNTDRSIKLAVKTGIPKSSPVTPTLDRDADNYELCLAYIKVPQGATIIQQSNITDTRLNADVCGIVGALVEQWDMTQYGTQLNGYITQYMATADDSYQGFINALNAWFTEYKDTSQSEFTAWFNSMKDQLSEDAAGNLQLQIDALQTKIDEQQAKINEVNDDFAVMKRESMAPYGYFGIEQDLDTLMSYVKAGQWDKFAIGDYFIDTRSNGQKVMWEIADKNGYLYCGDLSPFEDNHIICIPRDCLYETLKYNTSDTNTGGYTESLMPAALEKIADTFSTKLQGYMTYVQRCENNKGNDWPWVSRRISLPSVMEISGHKGWADVQSSGPVCHSLALFTGGNAHAMKGSGFSKSERKRMTYWLADPSAANTTDFCSFGEFGDLRSDKANNIGGVAPLIVLTKS